MTDATPVTGENNTIPQRLYDIFAAVAYLKKLGGAAATPTFVRGLINRGEVPHLRIGKKFYVSREALDIWISRRERRSPSR